MDDNAFHLLGILPVATRSEIADARQEAAFDGNVADDVLEKAESAITQPLPRLREELSFLWGAPKEKIGGLLRRINDARNGDELFKILQESAFPAITRANIAADFCGRKNAASLFSEVSALAAVSQIVEAQKKIDESSIGELINSARKKSKAVPVIAEEHLREELKKLRASLHKKAALNLICDMPHAGKFAEQLAEKYQFDKSAANRFVRDLICNDYKNWARPTKLQPLEEEIDLAAKILNENPKNNAALQGVENNLIEWDTYCQPIQLMEEGKGFDDERSREVFGKLRKIAVDLHNEHGETEIAQRLTETLSKVFSELPDSSNILAKDAKALDDFMRSREDGTEAIVKDFQQSFEIIKESSEFSSVRAGNMFFAFERLVNRSDELLNVSKEANLWDHVRKVIVHSISLDTINRHEANEKPSRKSFLAAIDFLVRLDALADAHGVNGEFKRSLQDDISSLRNMEKRLCPNYISMAKVFFFILGAIWLFSILTVK